MPWLSVLVPVYRVEGYLEACVESVLRQNIDGVEIILLNDGSTDRSGQVALDLQARHPETVFVLFHDQNRGLAAARNTLLESARGNYFWFLDSDDEMIKDVIVDLRAIVESDAPDLVLCDFSVLRERSGLRHQLFGARHRSSHIGDGQGLSSDRNLLIKGLLLSRQLHVWSKIAKREIWQQVRFPDYRCFQDMAVIPQLVASTTTWRHVARPWINYRRRADSNQAILTPEKALDALAAMNDLQAGFDGMRGELDDRVHAAAAYFRLRLLARLARKLPEDHGLDATILEVMSTHISDEMMRAIDQCRRRGWWLRAWRAHRSLARRGWLRSDRL